MEHLPGGSKAVGRPVDDLLLEHVARLLGDALAEVLVVDLDAGHVAGVAGDHGGLPLSGALYSHKEEQGDQTQIRSMKRRGDGQRIMRRGGHLGFSLCHATYLLRHVVIARPVEVLVGPLGEGVLCELARGTMVLEGELRVRLEEL